jgi:O-antigen/teichoic acid export membrane protein
MRSNLLKKFLSFSYGGFVGAAIGFFTTMITTRILQPEEFGKASMFTLFISLASIVVIFGTDQTFVRFFYEEDEKKRGSLLYSCLKVVAYTFIPVLIFILIFRERLLYFLFDENNVFIFLAVIFAILIQTLYRFATLVIRMQQKGNLFSIVEILSRLLILGAVLVFYVFIGGTYHILVFSTVLSFVLLLFVLIVTQKKFWKTDNFNEKKLTHSKKDIFYYSYPLVFTTSIMWVFEGFDKFAIRHWADFNELGLYSAAFKIIGLLSIMKVAFITFWTPVAYETFQNNPSNIEFYSKVSKLVSFMMMIVAIVVIMFKDVIVMLLGTEYQDASLMLSFLVFIPIMYTISETTVIGINFHKKVKWHILIATISCVVNILGNWWLVPRYGGIGASISTGISYVVFFTMRTFISLYYYKVNYGLKKLYTATVIVAVYSSYSLWVYQPVQEQLFGIVCVGLIIAIYYHDVRSLLSLRANKK